MSDSASRVLSMLTAGFGLRLAALARGRDRALPEIPGPDLVERLVRDTNPEPGARICGRCAKHERIAYPRVTARDTGGSTASSLVDDRPCGHPFRRRTAALANEAYTNDENTWEERSMAHGGWNYAW